LNIKGDLIMAVQVDDKKCVGCGLCAFSCPREAIHTYGISMIDSEKCTECFGGTYSLDGLLEGEAAPAIETVWIKTCIRNCPVKALSEA
jgi:ferredoxin